MEQIEKIPNHNHAWIGSWNRPMLIDEDKVHPFTVARMTDHNVRGNEPPTIVLTRKKVISDNIDKWETEGGNDMQQEFYSDS
jgi:hypothetical protein